MQTFKDYLVELFDKPLPFEVVQNTFSILQYKFVVNDNLFYEVSIYKNQKLYDVMLYDVNFSAIATNDDKKVMISTNSQEVSNKGYNILVMSTIIAICKHAFMEICPLHHGDIIVADGTTGSRNKLYNVIIKKFLTQAGIPFAQLRPGKYEIQ